MSTGEQSGRSREESAIVADYGERYRARDLEAARRVEMAALGTSCGANGYTTQDQADELLARLDVGAGDRVLDLGCGCGWPGLRFAQAGCRVFGTDLPLEGLARGARQDAGGGLLSLVRASARTIPFRPGTFAAVIHSDVLC